MNSEKRIESLESQVRTLKRIVCGIGFLLVASVALAATSMRVADPGNFTDLTCTSLTVNDGAIKLTRNGTMTTKLYSDPSVFRRGGALKLYNLDGQRAAYLCANYSGKGAVLKLRNTERQRRAVTLSGWSGGGRMYTYDKDGNEVFTTPNP